ncbi:hypothetical protein [Actinoplanes sp. G11-F43]|uniref:hypothetical protein n=1 Tax=Actinoplanes sp. G11-F43 TaxID=3424130 RepID=UPI003D325A6C
MRNQNRAGIAAAAVAAMMAGVTGCAGNQPSGAAGGDATQVLIDSVAGLRAGNYTFTRTGAGFIADIQQGAVALPDGMSIRHTGTFAVTRAGTETLLQYALHGDPEMREQYLAYWKKNVSGAEAKKIDAIYAQLDGRNWVRTTDEKLAETAAVEEQSGLDSMATLPTPEKPDSTGAVVLVEAVTSAERSGDTITGTLDATGQDPFLRRAFSEADYLYGPGAKAMPFRATLDGQGRLTEFTVTMPSVMASQPAEPYEPSPPLVIRISDYGVTEAPKPPAQVTGELSAQAYDLLARDTD